MNPNTPNDIPTKPLGNPVAPISDNLNKANTSTDKNSTHNPANTSHDAPKGGLTSPNKDQHTSLNSDSSKSDTHALPTNAASIKANWNQLKGLLKSNYPKLTDADLNQMESKPDHLSASIQTKVGDTRENIDAFIMSSLENIMRKA